jgi:thioredoxin 1
MSRIIDEKSAKHVQDLFESRFKDPVDVTLYTGQENEDAVSFTRQFLEELSELDQRIQLETRALDDAARSEGITTSPTIALGRSKGYRIEVSGAPSGHEAGALVETLAMISSGESGLSSGNAAKASQVDKEVLLYSFVTPTCPHCPGSVLQNHKIAMAAPGKVRSVAVSAAENMELAQKFSVSSVPQQVINEDPDSSSVGIQPEGDFIDQVLQYGASNYDSILAEARAQEAEAEKLVDDPGHPLKITDKNFREAVDKYPFLVVDCWAEWCGPCKMIGPIVEDLAGEQKGRMVFGKLNTEENVVIPAEFDIRSIPTLLVFKNGELSERIVGAMPKEALLEKLESLI